MYPTQSTNLESDDITVVTGNLSTRRQQICASSIHPRKPSIPITHAVADTGATPIMIMKKMPNMKNVRPATTPLKINLPDGSIVQSTHICDLEIPGLPHGTRPHSGITCGNKNIMQAGMHCCVYRYSVLCVLSRTAYFNGI